MTKSYHSSALPTDAAATARQRREWGAVRAAHSSSGRGCEANGCPSSGGALPSSNCATASSSEVSFPDFHSSCAGQAALVATRAGSQRQFDTLAVTSERDLIGSVRQTELIPHRCGRLYDQE